MISLPDPAPTTNLVRFKSEVDAHGSNVIAAAGDPKSVALGLLDVTQAPYHADPSGTRDASAAINRAIADARDARLITYLPAGRYLISKPIVGIQGVVRRDTWMFGVCDAMVENHSYSYPCSLVGPREGGRATLVLSREAPAFDDPAHPQPVVLLWSRNEMVSDLCPEPNPTIPQANISFNQQISDLDFELGGHPGAIAIYHQGAQMSVIEDVNIDATGAFAGLQGLPGSGGGTHGLVVKGGRYGIYARGTFHNRGSQPGPVVSDARFEDQSEAAVLYDGRGSLTLVGIETINTSIIAEAPTESPFNGPLNVVDSILRARPDQPAVHSSHPVFLSNTFIAANHTTALVAGESALAVNPGADTWTHVLAWGGGKGLTLVDGTDSPIADVRPAAPPPSNPLALHTHVQRVPTWTNAANVRAVPFGAAGDGKADDTDAIQRAIDTCDAVFVPRGEYRITRPLRLRATTVLFGTGPTYSSIVADEHAIAFRDALKPAPMIETVDDASATTVLAYLELRLHVNLAGGYALSWRAGRSSLVRNVNFERTLWDPDSAGLFHPFIHINGHGGGSWYHLHMTHWWSQSHLYRHLLVEGTREPLRIYMFNPEHARCEFQTEFRDAHNVSIYGLKAEGNYPVFMMKDCRAIRVFGYAGVGSPWPGWAILNFSDCRDVLVANVCPQLNAYRPGKWTALGIRVGTEGWDLIADGDTRVSPTVSLICYRLS